MSGEVITIRRSFLSGGTTPREIECAALVWVRGGEGFQFDISLDARELKKERERRKGKEQINEQMLGHYYQVSSILYSTSI